MSREFEKWAQANGLPINKFNDRHDVYLMDETRDAEFAFQGGYDSRQPEIDALRARVAELEFGAKSVLQMLLTEQNTKSALFKAEDMLRAMLASPPAPMVPEVDRD